MSDPETDTVSFFWVKHPEKVNNIQQTQSRQSFWCSELWASQTCRHNPAQWEALKRKSFVSFVGFDVLQQEGKAASTTVMRTGKGVRGVYEDTVSPAITSPCFEISLILAIITLKGIYRIIISICLTVADCRHWRCLSQFIHCTCTNTA